MSHCPQPKTCRRCGAPVPRGTWHGGPPRVYCSRRCNNAASQLRALERARAAGADAMRLIRAMREETPPGLCIYCDVRLPPSRNGRPRFRCDSAECLRAYRADYSNARRNPPEAPRGDA